MDKKIQSEHILVMIASYKDDELMTTLYNCIDNAKSPEKVHFALCCQDEVTVPYLNELKHIPNLNFIFIPANESKGCCYARSLTANLYDGEEYILQIDSHMRFVKDWDTKAIEMLTMCHSDKPLLTAYCPDIEEYELYIKNLKIESSPKTNAYFLDKEEEQPFDFFLLEANGCIKSDKPVLGAYISGHFLFAKADFLKEVPYDPYLYFHGEEYSLSVRAYTNGWDIYYPHESVCFHKYERVEKEHPTERTLHWHQHNSALFNLLSRNRVKEMMNGADLGIYGVGSVRSIEEYKAFADSISNRK